MFTEDSEVNHIIFCDCIQTFWRSVVFETKNIAFLMEPLTSYGSVMDPRFIESGLKIGTNKHLDILKNSL